MQIIKGKNYEDISQKAAQFILKRIHENNRLTLGLATGGTPRRTYEYLIKDYENNHTSYQTVSSFNLDEYIGLAPSDPNSYHYYMYKQLFSKIDIPKDQIFLPNGLATDLANECLSYERKIKEYGGIDLQLLGIGENGHIGFNEPGTPFNQRTHVVSLTESTIEANARFFDSIDEVPRKAITVGIATILKSKEILLLVTGKSKQAALKRLIESNEVSEDFPASALRKHENVTIIADEEALSKLESS
ncbi:glucosamine-6-phosphate deaminase [Gracilibacillus dipsosauri]|uniref:Glucosamine-6-phosphate deaminase n=1 Tax=Gracilibacillus dipsosauri TaxID=178340 RepID=A0A317KW52_9BACI|nr:glucosamine-6-phosphate deaminase [Gracilibacillus dipsosauri]PWU67596.1 glucosamine-6-phosphate deaminase [Gracilibacillus dipsosauri]